jgi:hypothetical protein
MCREYQLSLIDNSLLEFLMVEKSIYGQKVERGFGDFLFGRQHSSQDPCPDH